MKKSKKIELLIALLLVLLLTVAIAACTPDATDPCANGHDWDEENIEIITEPTCTAEGEGIRTCKVCGTKENFTLPKSPHDLKPSMADLAKNKAETCTKEGFRCGTCRNCNQYIEEVIPALGHDFTGTATITKESTCEEQGTSETTCRRKNCDGDGTNTPAKQINPIPELGHDWQDVRELDKEPTFTAAGSSSLHCNRCDKTKDEQVVPQLVAGQQVEYSLRVVRANREILATGIDHVSITVKDGSGKTVATSNRENFANGVMKVSLDPQQYTVTVANLPNGYTADASYNLNAGTVLKDLVVHSNVLPASQATSETRYTVGSVMHDYTFVDVRNKNNTTTLSQLLITHKIVLFNFFFSDCSACQVEMPGLISAYNLYKNDVAIVMLDVVDYDTDKKIRDEFLNEFGVPDTIWAVQDMTPKNPGEGRTYNNICEKFGFNTAPQNIIIDREGVVLYAEGGSTSEMEFRALFKKYTSAPYWQQTSAATSTVATTMDSTDETLPVISRAQAVLPKKQEW